jgi:hypothetical protein
MTVVIILLMNNNIYLMKYDSLNKLFFGEFVKSNSTTKKQCSLYKKKCCYTGYFYLSSNLGTYPKVH